MLNLLSHNLTIQPTVGLDAYVVSRLRNETGSTWTFFGPCLIEQIEVKVTLNKDHGYPVVEKLYFVQGFVNGFPPSRVFLSREKALAWAKILNNELKGGE